MKQSLSWFYLVGLSLLLGCSGSLFACPAWGHDQEALSLTFLGRLDLKDLGPEEPSGATWGYSAQGKLRLWVVSDDSPQLYVLKGARREDDQSTFKIEKTYSLSSELVELEGVTMDASGGAVLVQESSNSVIRLESDTFEEVERIPLAEMVGFDSLQDYFVAPTSNKGLEGIAWNTTHGTYMVVKEGRPPMLIELRADLHAILNHWILDQDRSFTVPGLSQDKLDVSGIAYDAHRDVFWLVSDKGKSLIVYDYHQHKVTQRIPLGYRVGKRKGIGRYQRIQKAEGVALSPDGATLTIVSDKKDAGLYVYAIQE